VVGGAGRGERENGMDGYGWAGDGNVSCCGDLIVEVCFLDFWEVGLVWEGIAQLEHGGTQVLFFRQGPLSPLFVAFGRLDGKIAGMTKKSILFPLCRTFYGVSSFLMPPVSRLLLPFLS